MGNWNLEFYPGHGGWGKKINCFFPYLSPITSHPFPFVLFFFNPEPRTSNLVFISCSPLFTVHRKPYTDFAESLLFPVPCPLNPFLPPVPCTLNPLPFSKPFQQFPGRGHERAKRIQLRAGIFRARAAAADISEDSGIVT
jgi:hypothetical protein